MLGSITHEGGLVHHAHFKTWRKHYNLAMCKMTHSVPKVIFLQAAEFYSVRSKNYKNGHKNIFGLSVVLELKVKNSTFLTFKVILFFYVKNPPNPSLFFIEEYKNGNFYYCHILITLIFNVVVFLKEDPILNRKAKNIFMAIFVVHWSYLLTTKLSCLQKNNFGHTKQAASRRRRSIRAYPFTTLGLHCPKEFLFQRSAAGILGIY